MDSDQVFDHRKFDSGALQSSTAPTDTPGKSVYFQRVVAELKLDISDPLTRLLAKACALLDQRDDLRRELSATRREADELARRVAFQFSVEAVNCARYGSVSPGVEEIIARVRAEMEKEKRNG